MRNVEFKGILPLGLLLVLTLTACDRGNSYQEVEDVEDDMASRGRIMEFQEGTGYMAPENAMELDPVNPILPVDPNMGVAGGEQGITTESGIGYADSMVSQGYGFVMNLSSGGLVEGEVVETASYGEMKAHSKYRATSRGWVYDPAGTEYQFSDLWVDAQRSIDDAGREIQRAMTDFGHKEKREGAVDLTEEMKVDWEKIGRAHHEDVK